LFAVDQRGVIRIFKNEVATPVPFLDLSADNAGPVIGGEGGGDEKGMLGLAFHPNYSVNGQFFVYYTTSRNGAFHDLVVRCEVSEDNPDVAKPTCVDVLVYRDPYTNHQGGMLEFGPDGFLYLGTGDGGGGGDPFGYTQDPMSLHGKMLRIDVDNKLPNMEYGIPSDNPYANGGGAPEVFMRGLRNPWRWSFDRATGDMWIGDVGQQLAEEINVLRPAQQKGANLGWPIYEGNDCCETTPYRCVQAAPAANCDPTNVIFPKDTRHGTGVEMGWRAIIAGEVYRGSCFPDLYGWHIYTDWFQRDVTRARLKADDTLEIVDSSNKVPGNPASLHASGRGELYLTNTDGYVYRLEAGP
jgi:glucose/arabinose dehydrogenase